MNYYCVTGVDGAGKSTWVRQHRGDFQKVFVPQYHLSEVLEKTGAVELIQVSQAIEDWSQRCDRDGLAGEKPFALFAGILLAGPVLRFLSRHYGAETRLLLDRDPHLDPLIYFSAYGPQLKKGNPPQAFKGLTGERAILTAKIFNQIARDAGLPEQTELAPQLAILLGFAIQDPQPPAILQALRRLTGLPWSSQTFVLTLEREELVRRLVAKHAGQKAEQHENIEWLLSAQDLYRQLAPQLPWPVATGEHPSFELLNHSS